VQTTVMYCVVTHPICYSSRLSLSEPGSSSNSNCCC